VDVELRHLRAFVAVAEELNFTRAARRLFLAQQALSTQIRQLEERVGAQLLVRTTRSVALTQAGEALYAQAHLLLASADAAVAAARAAAVATTPLTVGFVAAVDHGDVSHALDRFAELHPDVRLLVRFGDLPDPTGGLRTRDADVAFVYGPFDQTDLVVVPLFSEPMGVAVAADHPLACREVVTIADVVAEPTFDFPTPDAAWRAYWSAAAHRDGRPVRLAAQYRTLEGLVAALRAGLGVHLATEGLVASAAGGIAWRRLDDVEPLVHAVARRADDDRPTVRAFVDAAVEVLSR
jgi:DNA-binding transcriptional LysR family regulator